MPNSNSTPSLDPSTALAALTKAVKQAGDGELPVDQWNPEFCGEMDLVIRKDGSWWHEGARIGRFKLIKLFSRVLRHDVDGEYYLVTPVEKIKIKVERAPFIGVRIDVTNTNNIQRIFVTTDMDDVVELGPDHSLDVVTDEISHEPTPFVHVRGRLRALLNRASFYELVEYAQERPCEGGGGGKSEGGMQLGVYSNGQFFALGPPDIHQLET